MNIQKLNESLIEMAMALSEKVNISKDLVDAIKKDMKKTSDPGFMADVFNSIEIDGEIKLDPNSSGGLAVSRSDVDNVTLIATSFVDSVLDDFLNDYLLSQPNADPRNPLFRKLKSDLLKELRGKAQDIVGVWKGQKFHISGPINSFDNDGKQVGDVFVRLEVEPKAFKYNKSKDEMEISSVKIIKSEVA